MALKHGSQTALPGLLLVSIVALVASCGGGGSAGDAEVPSTEVSRANGDWVFIAPTGDAAQLAQMESLAAAFATRFPDTGAAQRAAAAAAMEDAKPAVDSAASISGALITDCAKYYLPPLPGSTQRLANHVVYIDALGRPTGATWKHGPAYVPVAGSRDDACQRLVGTWGRRADDQGGHIIAAALGGWGGRANLFPQNGTLNNSSWKTIEGFPKKCALKWPTEFSVVLQWPDNKLRPNQIGFQLWITLPTGEKGYMQGVLLNEIPDAGTMAKVEAYRNMIYSPVFCGP